MNPALLTAVPRPVLISFILSAILAVYFATWLYNDAKERDSGPLLWSILLVAAGAIVLPFLGIPLIMTIYLLRRNKGRVRPCPHCGKMMLESLAECPFCKRMTLQDCLYCHEAIPVGSLQCPSCGRRVGLGIR